MDLKKVTGDAWRFTKAVCKGLAEGINEGINNLESLKKEVNVLSKQKEETTINAEMAERIRWMNPGQLRAIFEGKTVKTDSDPRTWDQLRWMSKKQLEAVFGKESKGNDY